MTAARAAQEQAFWLMPEQDAGYHSLSYAKRASFFTASYLSEQLQPNAQAIHMSTELMREHFPFLGNPQ